MSNLDIPKEYDITHFPSDGRYYPMFNGKFLWSGYRNSTWLETTDSPYQAFRCESINECVEVIRKHMEWKKPVMLSKSDWRK